MLIKRREFLKISSLATASMLMPNFLKAMTLDEALNPNQNILVVLQFTGGNDGLNTIIPAKNDIYFRERKTLAIQDSIPLTDEAGINPALSYFKELFDNGELSVMNNVGYPNPDKSHFRSMDIWQSASRSDQFLETGWLGRFLDEECYRCDHPTQALEVDDMLSLALKGENNKAFAFKDPKRLYQTSQEKYFKSLYDHHHDDETVSYLYQTLGSTINNADYIFEKSKAKKTEQIYPNSQLGKDFKTVASLIKSDINTQVYYLSIGSFDTHVNQNDRQKKLFDDINEAVKSFVADMKSNGLFNNILLMTFSEFGRRVAQNASNNGTDHGTANQMFFISGNLKKKGLLNALPDLQNLNEGDLIYKEDFRKVYATILKNWLKADSSKVLGWKDGIYDFV